MRLLLDTHTFIWWAAGHPSLPGSARKRISESQDPIFVSAASAWEMAIKVSLGRLASAADLISDFEGSLRAEYFLSLPITAEHGIRAGLLPAPHKDPFDRMLIAQAQAENLAIVSNDEIFDQYGIRRLW